MFGFWDGLKMRVLALMAMLATAGPATVAVAKTPTITTSAPKTVVAQTVTPPKDTPKNQTNPKDLTPSNTQPALTPPADDTTTPVKQKRCGCATEAHKNYKCAMYCRYLDEQTQ
jgi:hypothetical protein